MAIKSNVKSTPHHHHHHHHHNGNGCVKNWEDNLKRTKFKLKSVCANKDSYNKKLTNSLEWELKLKKYWECIQATEDLAEKVADDLELFKEHTKKVCGNTICSEKAIKILYCYVLELFNCIDSLKDFLVDLLKEIECLDPEINAKTSKIVACLVEISLKLDEAISTQKVVIKSVIKVLQSAYILHESICSSKSGLIHKLHVLCELFPQSKEDCHDVDVMDIEQSCTATIEPKPVIPLNQDMFYELTRSQHISARREKYRIKRKYEKWRAKCEDLTACKSSLEVAISTSNEVKECVK